MRTMPKVMALVVAGGMAACIEPAPALQTTSSSSATTSGTGGGAPQASGHDASGWVSAGLVAKNAQHRMVFTVGLPAGEQGTMKNAGHRLEGGLVGATEVTP